MYVCNATLTVLIFIMSVIITSGTGLANQSSYLLQPSLQQFPRRSHRAFNVINDLI